MVHRLNLTGLESRLESPVNTRRRIRRSLGVILLAISMGAAGYGLKSLETRIDYHMDKLTKPYMMKVTDHAIRQGYTDDIWKMFPEHERYRLVKKDIVEMPVNKSWDVVKPALSAKIKYELEELKDGIYKMFSEIGDKLKSRKDDKPSRPNKDNYDALKQYLGN